jgi:hypothetical protein
MTKLKRRPLMRSGLSALAFGVALAAGLIPAQAHADETCPRLCITDIHIDGHNLHIAWTGKEPFANYEVYWERQGTTDIRTQNVDPGQSAYDIPDVQPGATYRVQVLGCAAPTPWLADGPCGAVDQRIITT